MSHVWTSTDSSRYLSCLVCGGAWENVEPESFGATIDMRGHDGELAPYCTGNTEQCHHYAGECPEDECQLDAICNCVHCY